MVIKSSMNYHTFPYSDEKYILSKYKKLILEESNNKRMEKLIWNKSWASSRRQLKRVSNNIKLLSTAKINLSRRKFKKCR